MLKTTLSASNNAGVRISLKDVSRIVPVGLDRFMKPRVECGFDRLLVFATFQFLNKLPQSLPRYDSHRRVSGDMKLLYSLFPKWVQAKERVQIIMSGRLPWQRKRPHFEVIPIMGRCRYVLRPNRVRCVLQYSSGKSTVVVERSDSVMIHRFPPCICSIAAQEAETVLEGVLVFLLVAMI